MKVLHLRSPVFTKCLGNFISYINAECIVNKSGSLTQQHACRQMTTNSAAATNALKYVAAPVETIITIAIVCESVYL